MSRVILHLRIAKDGGTPPISPVRSHIEPKYHRLPSIIDKARLTSSIADIVRRQKHLDFRMAEVIRKYTGSVEWNETPAKSHRQTPHFRLCATSVRQYQHCPSQTDIGEQSELKITSGFGRHFEFRMSVDVRPCLQCHI